MAGKGGGAWKVAYADFVTAMMAFFLVMWITAQSKPVRHAIAEYFSHPSRLKSKVPGTAPTQSPEYGAPSLMVQPEIGLGGAGVSLIDVQAKREGRGKGPGTRKPNLFVVHGGQQETTGTIVSFDESSAELDDPAKERLQRLVPALLGKRSKIEIRGHATRRPLGTESPFQDAWQLCYARCLAVRQYLERAGVETERFRLSQAGVYEPQTIRETQEKQNARVEVFVLAERVEDLTGSPEERRERIKAP